MAQVQLPPAELKPSAARLIPDAVNSHNSHPRSRLELDTRMPVNGCFEADRVLKSGYIQKRTSKTKVSHRHLSTLPPAPLVLTYHVDMEAYLPSSTPQSPVNI